MYCVLERVVGIGCLAAGASSRTSSISHAGASAIGSSFSHYVRRHRCARSAAPPPCRRSPLTSTPGAISLTVYLSSDAASGIVDSSEWIEPLGLAAISVVGSLPCLRLQLRRARSAPSTPCAHRQSYRPRMTKITIDRDQSVTRRRTTIAPTAVC